MKSKNEIEIEASPDDVFDVLCDPTTYPDWLVGAQEVVHVDPAWPAVGAKFHHRIGLAMVRIPGSTSIRRVDRPNLVELGAGMGPLGEALVTFVLEPTELGTRVSVHERPRRGLASIAGVLFSPLVSLLLWGRNAVSLDALRERVIRNAAGAALAADGTGIGIGPT